MSSSSLSQIAPPLQPGDIHLWKFTLNAASSDTLLSADETARMQRLIDPIRRRRFAAARTTLRRILSAYVNTPPDQLDFDYSAQGKPSLRGHDLGFNLAHSDDQAVLVIALQPVGVDLERFDPQANLSAIMDIAFTPDERAAFDRLPSHTQPMAFLRTWTRKEALIKAHGDGFRAAHLFSLPVTAEIGQFSVDGWTVVDVDIPAGVVASVAIQGADPKLTHICL